jgi:hypothetical protein
MQLSKETLNKLKNFAEINQNLLIKPGPNLNTLSNGKTVMATASVTEDFGVTEKGFGIYDLNEFLGIVSLFENPDLNFSEKFVTISEGKTSIKYFAADQNVLTFPTKELNFPTPEIVFNMTSSILQSIRKVAAVLKTSDISIVGDGTEIKFQAGDKKNATANAYSSIIGETDKEFVVNLKVDNLKLLPGDYNVQISSKKICKFSNDDLVYFIAAESDSTFSV